VNWLDTVPRPFRSSTSNVTAREWNARDNDAESDHGDADDEALGTAFEHKREIFAPAQRFVRILHRRECEGHEDPPKAAEHHTRRHDDPEENEAELPYPPHPSNTSEPVRSALCLHTNLR